LGKTAENVGSAFAGESQANRRYLFFAEKAEAEGHNQVARLFRAAAEAETVHARNHLRVIQGINSTQENLRTAIGGENHEFTKMYPEYISQAEAENEGKAKNSFDLANKVEEIHHGLFKEALQKLEKGQSTEERPFYVCQVCGNTVEGGAPDRCPVCGAPQKAFKRVD